MAKNSSKPLLRLKGKPILENSGASLKRVSKRKGNATAILKKKSAPSEPEPLLEPENPAVDGGPEESMAEDGVLDPSPEEKVEGTLELSESKGLCPSFSSDGAEVQVPLEKRAENHDVKCRVSRGQLEKAVKSLRKWLQSQEENNKSQLLGSDDMFYVVFSFHTIPEKVSIRKGLRIPIPHSLYPLNAGHEICLFVKDMNVQAYRKLKKSIMSDKTMGITKVMRLVKLRKNYKPFEAKVKLCRSYDFFLSDGRITPILPKLLGKTFFRLKKFPVAVNLNNAPTMPATIRRACDSTYLYFGGGNCSSVRTARTSQSDDEVIDNIMAVISGAEEKLPSKWKSIRSICIKTLESVSLPVYMTLPAHKLKLENTQK